MPLPGPFLTGPLPPLITGRKLGGPKGRGVPVGPGGPNLVKEPLILGPGGPIGPPGGPWGLFIDPGGPSGLGPRFGVSKPGG